MVQRGRTRSGDRYVLACCRWPWQAYDGMKWRRSAPRIPLVGRSAEIAVLRGVIEGATARRHPALIEGEAGIGKTRVLDEALNLARRRGFDVLVGACDELERDRRSERSPRALPIEATIDPRRSAPRWSCCPRGPVRRRPRLRGWRRRTRWLIVEVLLDVLEEAAATAPVAFAVEEGSAVGGSIDAPRPASILRHLTRPCRSSCSQPRARVRHTDVDRTLADLVH